jgi:hypothetical protein
MPYARRTTRWVWLLTPSICVALLATGCAGGSRTAGESGPVGQITHVFSVESLMNGTVASAGDDIRPGAVLTTDETGVMEFELAAMGVACRLSQAAEASIPENGERPVRYANGTAVCRVTSPSRDTLVLEVGEQTVRVERSVFRIKFDQDGHNIAVLKGAMVVEAPPVAGDDGTEESPAQYYLDTGQSATCGNHRCLVGSFSFETWSAVDRNAAELFTADLRRFDEETRTEFPSPGPSDIDQPTTPVATEPAPPDDGNGGPSEEPAPQPTTPGGNTDEQDNGAVEPDADEAAPPNVGGSE